MGNEDFVLCLSSTQKHLSKSCLASSRLSPKVLVPGPLKRPRPQPELRDAGVAWILVKDIFSNPLVGSL